jgi:hypothetical protein
MQGRARAAEKAAAAASPAPVAAPIPVPVSVPVSKPVPVMDQPVVVSLPAPVPALIPQPVAAREAAPVLAAPPLTMSAISAAFQDRLGHAEPVARTSSRSERYQAVYELADMDLPVDEIARKTRVLPGEVELILSLKPSRRAVPRPAAEQTTDLDDN